VSAGAAVREGGGAASSCLNTLPQVLTLRIPPAACLATATPTSATLATRRLQRLTSTALTGPTSVPTARRERCRLSTHRKAHLASFPGRVRCACREVGRSTYMRVFRAPITAMRAHGRLLQIAMRSGYDANATWVWFDVGPYGSSGHGESFPLYVPPPVLPPSSPLPHLSSTPRLSFAHPWSLQPTTTSSGSSFTPVARCCSSTPAALRTMERTLVRYCIASTLLIRECSFAGLRWLPRLPLHCTFQAQVCPQHVYY
jgi:hypothetical protein